MGNQQSSITFSQAKSRVADTAGASSSTAELTRAGYAVQAAFQDWNNDEAWAFLGKSSTALTVTSGAATLPTDFKYMYGGIITNTNQPLYPISQALMDIATFAGSVGTPAFYSLFKGGLAGSYQIKITPTPTDGSTITLNYHRSMAIPTADSDVLDIPQDYENYLLAEAKYLYLLDKGGEPERAAGWKDYYESGKRKAIMAESRRPQESKLLIPEGGLHINTSLDNPDIISWAEQ